MPEAAKPPPILRKQAIMRRVILATLPCVAGAVYYFGWRTLAVIGVACAVGFLAEWLLARRRGEPASEAVFVTAILFGLVMPPTVPWHVVIFGILFAVVMTKELFGGWSRNVFNPALAGRCFVYVCFPVALTAVWAPPAQGTWGALGRWSTYDRDAKPDAPDAVTSATPMAKLKTASLEAARLEERALESATPATTAPGRGDGLDALRQVLKQNPELDPAREEQARLKTGPASHASLLLGRISGTAGVTSALLILVGGLYLFLTKTANRTIIITVIAAYAVFNQVLHWCGVPPVPDAGRAVLGGGFLFGAFFMATDPISAAKTGTGRIIYGIIIALGTMTIRNFSIFNGGLMFSILLGNMFAPIIDHTVTEHKKAKKASSREARKSGEKENST
jgi:Na+-transporting NADH:ubiquinone oxidoreductase subunit B